MKTAINIDASGRLVLPKHLRERLNLHGGARLSATVVAGRLELTPMTSEAAMPLKRKGGIAVLARTGVRADAAAAMAAERDDAESRALARE